MDKIFIAIASYRDYELVYTIQDCIDKAADPYRLRFGICLQYDNELDEFPEAGENCIETYLGNLNYEVVKYDWRDSKGGCWARNKVQELYNGERYTLQVDSHSRFGWNWDQDLIGMINTLPSEKPLITCFPTGYYRNDAAREDDESYLEQSIYAIGKTVIHSWASDGWIHFTQREGLATPGFKKTPFLFGGFVFTHGEWNVEVMQDPKHYYTGEQEALSVRSYTHGYDLWNPDKKVVWHRVHPKGIQSKHFWDFEHSAEHREACRRLRLLWDGDSQGELGTYGPGSVRTVQQYLSEYGLEWPERSINPELYLEL